MLNATATAGAKNLRVFPFVLPEFSRPGTDYVESHTIKKIG